MKPTIHIRKNSDGEVRSFIDPFDWDGDFIWSDGNFACDCNRALFFGRANGGEGDECECGDTAYSVRITAPDGTELYADDSWSAALI